MLSQAVKLCTCSHLNNNNYTCAVGCQVFF
nr:MAG TPA: hypothetical protein [Caudoviricetes sp.]